MRHIFAIVMLLGGFSSSVSGQTSQDNPLREMRDALRGLRDALKDRPATKESEPPSGPTVGKEQQKSPSLEAEAGQAPSVVGTSPIHQCDILAAHPDDPRKGSAGVTMPIMEKSPSNAINACVAAMDTYPNEPRYQYQLARAYYARNRDDPRIRVNAWIAAQNRYPAAAHLMALLHIQGTGAAEKDYGLARQYLQAARELGMEVVAAKVLADLDALENKQKKEEEATQNRRIAAEKNRRDAAQQAVNQRITAQLPEAERKGIDFAKSNALKWNLSQTKDEMTGKSSSKASSTQSNSRHSAQVQVSCENSRLTISATLPAGAVPLELERSARLVWGKAEAIFIPAHKGRKRLNDMAVEDATFMTGKFQNVFELEAFDSERTYVKGYDSGPGYVLIWAYLAEFSTNAGPLVIKVPMYDASVQAVWSKC